MSTVSAVVQQMRSPLETITPQETEQQGRAGTLTSGKDVSRAMRDSMTGQNSLEVAAGKDSVFISEEGRARQKAMAGDREDGREKGPDGASSPGAKDSVKANLAGNTDANNTADQAREALLKQIKQVKEKLEKAQQRLAEASANEEAPSEQAEDAAARAVQGMSGGSETEAIQSEIKMLQQQLQTLYQQLQQSTQGGGGGGAPAMGTAGVGGAGGNGGMGERISVG